MKKKASLARCFLFVGNSCGKTSNFLWEDMERDYQLETLDFAPPKNRK
ncbi:MAG: hypothetical protein ACO1N0_15180 [Fluviicola sp.]